MTRAAIELTAPAKLNLALKVLDRRADGFHALRSWVVRIDWCDRLCFEAAPAFSLNVVDDGATAPTDSTNLVWRAAHELARLAGMSEPRAAITLFKSIPSGAGLGGGSSDAAATLLGLNRLWGLQWPAERLAQTAAALGSDVPLFLRKGPLLMEGRGEVLSPLALEWRGWATVVAPSFPLSTADVYRAWRPKVRDPALEALEPAGLRTANALLSCLSNDLEAPAFDLCPALRALHERLQAACGRTVRMTGSGSALFTLFDSQAEADAGAEAARGVVASNDLVHVARVT